MPNNIQIYCRVRPSRKPSGFFDIEPDSKLLEFQLPPPDTHEQINNTKVSHRFMFDGLFGMQCTQDSVFDTVAKAAVDNALNGYNATIFAYGQTGSGALLRGIHGSCCILRVTSFSFCLFFVGKTFTLSGGTERYEDRGLIPRSLAHIFHCVKQRTDAQYTAHVSYMEIYNEAAYDLLDPSQESKALEELP